MERGFVFLLSGKVQGVKLRRYIEAAGVFFQMKGFVVNTEEGDVYGEATGEPESSRNFKKWIQGAWQPLILTNEKPTPIGTAYPSKARVDVARILDKDITLPAEYNQKFVMVRNDDEALDLSKRMDEALRTVEGKAWSRL